MFDLSKIEYKHNNERDIEIAAVVNLVKEHQANIESLLDIGGHWSWNSYAPQLREFVKEYDVVDINPDPQTAAIVDNYWAQNVLDEVFDTLRYDMVISVSSLEHAGIIKVYPPLINWQEERNRAIDRINLLATKYIFITVPYGLPCYIPEGYANFTTKDLNYMLKTFGGKPQLKFYFREESSGPYHEISQLEAGQVPYEGDKGTRCNCFLFVDRT